MTSFEITVPSISTSFSKDSFMLCCSAFSNAKQPCQAMIETVKKKSAGRIKFLNPSLYTKYIKQRQNINIEKHALTSIYA